MKISEYDLIVVGGGILGSFHAFHALKANLSVALLEKDAVPRGATVRNFGQVVPSGMDSKWQRLGRESLSIYKSLQQQFDLTVREHGTVYLASDQEEASLLEELHQINKSNDYPSELLTREVCLARYPGLRSDYCVCGLLFPQEVTVEPREMIHRLRNYMIEQFKLDYYPASQVTQIQDNSDGALVSCVDGKELRGGKIIVCNGSEFRNLYPELFKASDLEVVKLQMLQTVPQTGYQIKGSILTGLTIRRYEAFQECESYAGIKEREKIDTFARNYGIHILFKQAFDGSVIIGDSHEYASVNDMDKLSYDLKADIDNFILNAAKKIMDLPDYQIQRRWYGLYSQCKSKDIFHRHLGENIQIVTGIGGKGMTGGAGYASQNINQIFNLQNL